MDANERKALRAKAEAARAWLDRPELADDVLALLDALEAAESYHGHGTSPGLSQEDRARLRRELSHATWEGDATIRLMASLEAVERKRDELAAEVAAYQGRPEGAIHAGWVFNSAFSLWCYDWRDYGMSVSVGVHGIGCWTLFQVGVRAWDDSGRAESPRAAMRAAEAAARAKGLL